MRPQVGNTTVQMCSSWVLRGPPHAASSPCPSYITTPGGAPVTFQFISQGPAGALDECAGKSEGCKAAWVCLLLQVPPTVALGSPACPPHCPAAPCTACADTAAGRPKVLITAAGSPVYSQPCKLPTADGTLPRCTTFQDTGRRQAIACAGQRSRTCYAQMRDSQGATHWVPEHLCAGGAAALADPGHPNCAGGGELHMVGLACCNSLSTARLTARCAPSCSCSATL